MPLPEEKIRGKLSKPVRDTDIINVDKTRPRLAIQQAISLYVWQIRSIFFRMILVSFGVFFLPKARWMSFSTDSIILCPDCPL